MQAREAMIEVPFPSYGAQRDGGMGKIATDGESEGIELA
jgi:hypothetical protein